MPKVTAKEFAEKFAGREIIYVQRNSRESKGKIIGWWDTDFASFYLAIQSNPAPFYNPPSYEAFKRTAEINVKNVSFALANYDEKSINPECAILLGNCDTDMQLYLAPMLYPSGILKIIRQKRQEIECQKNQ